VGLVGFAQLRGARFLQGQTALFVFFPTSAWAWVVSSNRRHKVHHGRGEARCLVSCRTTG
jgi:hypothetical protein